jgi:hypothetical protein
MRHPHTGMAVQKAQDHLIKPLHGFHQCGFFGTLRGLGLATASQLSRVERSDDLPPHRQTHKHSPRRIEKRMIVVGIVGRHKRDALQACHQYNSADPVCMAVPCHSFGPVTYICTLKSALHCGNYGGSHLLAATCTYMRAPSLCVGSTSEVRQA